MEVIGLLPDLGQRHKLKCQIIFFSVIVENRAGRTYEIHSEPFRPTEKQQFLPPVMERRMHNGDKAAEFTVGRS